MAGRGEVKWTLSLQADQFETAATRAANAFKVSTAAIGAAAVAVGAALAKITADTLALGGKFSDMQAKTGIAASSLQKLEAAGKLSGNSLEQLGGAVSKMQKGLVDGNSAFGRLGLSIDQLRNLKPDEAFAKVAEQIQRIPDPAGRAAAAMEVFGKSGADILPTLTSDFAAAAEEAERLGLVMSDDTVAAADALGDSLDTMQDTFGGVLRRFGEAIVESEAVHKAVAGLTEILAMFSKTITENKDTLRGWVSTGMSLAVQGLAKLVQAAGIAYDAFRNLQIMWSLMQEAGISSRLQNLNPNLSSEAPVIAQLTAQLTQLRQARAAMMQGTDQDEQRIMSLVQSLEDLGKTVGESGSKTVRFADDTKKAGAALEFLGKQADKVKEKFSRNNWIDPQGELGLTRLRTDWNEQLMQNIPMLAGGRGIGSSLLGETWVGLGKSMGQSITQSLKSALQGLPQIILGALQGGGDIGRSIGALFGSSIFGQGSSLVKGLTTKLSGALGSTLGGALGSIVPGLGTLLGGLAGGLADKLFGGLFGGARKREETEKAKQALLGEFQELGQKLDGMLRDLAQKGGKGFGDLLEHVLSRTDVTDERLQRMGTFAVATFEAMRKAGFSFVESVEAMQKDLDKLMDTFKDRGLEASDSLQRVFDYAAWVKLHESAINAAEGFNDMIAAMRGFGLVSADALRDLANEADALFTDLGGDWNDLTNGASQTALAILAPALLQIKNEAQRLGIALDKDTQSLIDAAEAGGLLDNVKDPLEKINDTLELMTLILAQLSKYFGVTLPDDIQKTIDKMRQIPPPPGPFNPGNDDPVRTMTTTTTTGGGGSHLITSLFGQRSGSAGVVGFGGDLVAEFRGMRADLRRFPTLVRDAVLTAR